MCSHQPQPKDIFWQVSPFIGLLHQNRDVCNDSERTQKHWKGTERSYAAAKYVVRRTATAMKKKRSNVTHSDPYSSHGLQRSRQLQRIPCIGDRAERVLAVCATSQTQRDAFEGAQGSKSIQFATISQASIWRLSQGVLLWTGKVASAAYIQNGGVVPVESWGLGDSAKPTSNESVSKFAARHSGRDLGRLSVEQRTWN